MIYDHNTLLITISVITISKNMRDVIYRRSFSPVFFNLGSANSLRDSIRILHYFGYLGSAKRSIMLQRFRDLKKVEKFSTALVIVSLEFQVAKCLIRIDPVNLCSSKWLKMSIMPIRFVCWQKLPQIWKIFYLFCKMRW